MPVKWLGACLLGFLLGVSVVWIYVGSLRCIIELCGYSVAQLSYASLDRRAGFASAIEVSAFFVYGKP